MSDTVNMEINRKSLGQVNMSQLGYHFKNAKWTDISNIEHYVHADDFWTSRNSHSSISRVNIGGLIVGHGVGNFIKVNKIPESGSEINSETPFDLEFSLQVPYKTIFGNVGYNKKYAILWPIQNEKVVIKLLTLFTQKRITELWDVIMYCIKDYRDSKEKGLRGGDVVVTEENEKYILENID